MFNGLSFLSRNSRKDEGRKQIMPQPFYPPLKQKRIKCITPGCENRFIPKTERHKTCSRVCYLDYHVPLKDGKTRTNSYSGLELAPSEKRRGDSISKDVTYPTSPSNHNKAEKEVESNGEG